METAGDRLRFVRATQFLKASSTIVVTESGIVMAVREEHPKKAPQPIVVTPPGMVMDVREEHS
jgi:quinolinate synthase